jgi:L-amino acid N-acyltransferase YncA
VDRGEQQHRHLLLAARLEQHRDDVGRVVDDLARETAVERRRRSLGEAREPRRQQLQLVVAFGGGDCDIIAGVEIRPATDDDWPAIWPFLRQIVTARETYAYDPDMSDEQARALWMVRPPARVVVATGDDGTVAGTANMYANRPGPGSHVASASFMVDPAHHGHGIGRALGEDVIAWARDAGFRAIQFNAVVETNERAVRLWKSLGFEVIGTAPEAFAHPSHGYVGLHVMYLRL